MSYELYKLAWEFPASEASEKLVLVYFADRASADGSNIYPALETVARHAAISLRSVQRAIKSLAAKGVVEQVKPADRARRKSAHYRLDLAKMREIVAAGKSEAGKPAEPATSRQVARHHVVLDRDTTSQNLRNQNDTMSPASRHHVVLGSEAKTENVDRQDTENTVKIPELSDTMSSGIATPCHPNLNPQRLTPRRSASPHAPARDRESPAGGNLKSTEPAPPSPSPKIEAAPQVALQEAETKTSAKSGEIAAASQARTQRDPGAKNTSKQLALIAEHQPKGKHLAYGGMPGHLIEPFEEFWSIYPRPEDKGAARIEFEQAVMSGKGTPAEIIERATLFRAERAGKDPDPADFYRFTQKPAKWLRAEGWKNAPAPAPRLNGNRQNPHDGMAEQRARLDANLAALQSGETIPAFDPSNPFGLEGFK
jgi:hypothetical protein